MSGGVGPASDISLPKDEPSPPQNLPPKITPKQTTPLGFFTFRQLNSLAFMLVLSASGMISLQDFTVVIFSTIYIFFLSKFSFPKQSITQEQPVFNQKSKILTTYILFAAVIGLFLPILYIFEGILEGDKEGIKAAVPHVFLLASQVFMEGVSASCRFSLPIRVFVPVFYNSVRMFTLIEWLKDEFLRFGGGGEGLSRRLVVGRGLAVANFGLWSFNLFGFLLPVYLPKALQRYYGGNGTNASSSKGD
ncbi:uncharacterized protein LOC141606471 [Silene latifolia]|uniref:uncharacterized protein LOC141606471 n=1 Tax=Silene latifolia TaxID=37657 RepID=UPI003D775C51